jgi:hypothetical protein
VRRPVLAAILKMARGGTEVVESGEHIQTNGLLVHAREGRLELDRQSHLAGGGNVTEAVF